MYFSSYDLPMDEKSYLEVEQNVGGEPVDGRVSHVALRLPDGYVRVVEVWQSREHSERATRDRVIPAIKAATSETHGETEPEREELPVIAVSGITATTFRVWRNAPLRSEPYVRQKPDHNVVDTIPGSSPADRAREWWAYAQCWAQYVENPPGTWNEYWIYAYGPSGRGGWLSMVDVDEGGNGQPKIGLPRPTEPYRREPF